MKKEEYLEIIEGLGRLASTYLNDMEGYYEQFRLHTLPQAQGEVKEKYGALLAQKRDQLANLVPPWGRKSFHSQFLKAYSHLVKSCEIFCHPIPSEAWILLLRGSRGQICDAMRLLYPLRLQIPGFARHWITEDELPNLDKIEVPPDPSLGVRVGLLYRDWEPQPPRYSLYVPENYHPGQGWPLIVALHGGGGNDHDFIWLWLKYAKSKGYILMCPKSMDFTWTFSDIQVIMAAIEEIGSLYNLNRQGIFLTGVSDGGTFTYEFGLSNPQFFAALASVAGGFIPWPWHDYAQGNHLPVYILHGAQDKIIPVEFAHAAREVLGKFGYPLTYVELPDWGHAWPFSRIKDIGDFFDKVLREKGNRI